MTLKIPISRLPHGKGLPLPAYATSSSAGMDLMAAIPSPQVLAPQSWALFPSGIQISLPKGYEAQVRPRSGLALKSGITVLNTPGTIDADYRGEIKVILINLGPTPFTIEPGMRMAQLVIAPTVQAQWQEQEEPLQPDIGRTSEGFGSTGLF